MRQATIERKTTETTIRVSLELDGEGQADIDTGIGFFDHMLTHLARHGLFDLAVAARGDLEVDAHHTVEDVGICLGKAFLDALGERKGIARFGHAVVPMDETLAEVAIDLSGRPFLAFDAGLPHGRVGTFESELTEEFFRAFTVHSGSTVHVMLRTGTNLHHCIEGIFKAFARALRGAVAPDPRVKGVPSTKGMLEA
ncbi:MAG: imidazoleglycerol-phosphate dehydratase HisB [Candidatus Hydrogenedentes bacterium]|nr:imidazoleglycerol-phosphate dehydratase HisB [Candidatus Hydrogenedentota bacterium]